MKKIGNKIKQNAKVIIAFVLGAILTGGTVYAATVLPSSQVGYDNSTSGLAATDVQGALDELNSKTQLLKSMQDFNKSSLSNVGDTTTLYDKRDGNFYTVRKLADGNVWMIENLRLINKTISSDDSNLPSGTTWTVPASSTSGFAYMTYDRNSAYLNNTYGGYYSFYAATAGWGTESVTSGNSPKDICPKGWRLPTLSEFETLYNSYNTAELLRNIPDIDSGGWFSSGQIYNEDSSYLWSSSATIRKGVAGILIISSSDYVFLDDSNVNKSNGMPMRCIAK